MTLGEGRGCRSCFLFRLRDSGILLGKLLRLCLGSGYTAWFLAIFKLNQTIIQIIRSFHFATFNIRISISLMLRETYFFSVFNHIVHISSMAWSLDELSESMDSFQFTLVHANTTFHYNILRYPMNFHTLK